jgi:integrase/recombinase XerD
MIEYIFRPSRIVDGKRVLSRVFCGRYALDKGSKPVQVGLNTPDREVARKRLRAIIVEKQREAEGIVAPKAVRVAAGTQLGQLVDDYETDLRGRELKEKHVRDTTKRVRRMIADNGWKVLSDVRPDVFVKWRASLEVSPKTKKEHHLSANAFLNWLVQMDRLMVNPLAKVPHVETRGKQVRPCRAFTEDELRRLFAVAGRSRLAYQMLLYTGQRKSEVRSLMWADLHLDEAQPYALFRESTTKDKDKRAVPLRPEIVVQLKAMRPADDQAHTLSKPIFWFRWPTYDLLRGDFKRAGIERVDALGRSVHFHSFRKTWQTLGVRYGINQRVAQEVLGHSDANLTAKVYTDVPALALHTEIAKLPWIEAATPPAAAAAASLDAALNTHTGSDVPASKLENAQMDAQKFGKSCPAPALADLCAKFVQDVNLTGAEGLSHVLASLVTSLHCDEMAARAGIEPVTK